MAARTTITDYSFSPAVGTFTFTALETVDLTQVVAIYDTSLKTLDGSTCLGYYPYPKGYPIYFATDQSVASVEGNVLTIPVDLIPPQAKSTDTLTIVYGFPVTPTLVHVQ